MLTEIEWWGGLLFIWGVLNYRGLLSGGATHRSCLIIFLFPGVLLALYFYPLASPIMRYSYLASLAVAILGLLYMQFWPDSEDKELEQTGGDNADEEEPDDSKFELLGQIIIFTPPVIACLLGSIKSFGIAQNLGWLS